MSFLLRNIADLKEIFNRVETPIFYITPNADKAVGLEKIIGNYHIICLDNDDEVDYLKKSGVNVFCLEKEMGQKNVLFRNSGLLLQRPEVVDYIMNKESPKDKPTGQARITNPRRTSLRGRHELRIKNHESRIKNKELAIIVFKPTLLIEKICHQNNWLLLNNSILISRPFEDKLNFYKIAQKLNLLIPKTGEIDVNETSYKKLREEFGYFVIQHPSGFAGRTTFFIKNKDDYLRFKKQYQEDKIKVSKFVDGVPITINACVTKSGTVVGAPCYQITGTPICTNNPATTCGNDWGILRKNFQSFDSTQDKFSIFPPKADPPPAGNFQLIYKKIEEITKTIGDYMARVDYKGIFGLDFVLEEKSGRIYLIECNPRLVASIPMATKLEITQGQIPLLIFHILEFLKIDYKIPNTRYQIPNTNISGAQLVIRNTEKKKCIVKGKAKSGVYKRANSPKNLKFVQEGYSSEDLKNPDEFIVLTVPKGRLVNPEQEVIRIESLESLLDKNYGPKKWVERVGRKIYTKLKLT